MEKWKQIVEMMDDEIREEIHARVVLSCYPCTEERFLEIYKEEHLKKYGEEFQVN